ncbi:unnamed protein product [Symbiodinium sp. KB8]|nr:unnamed protein product [Symbiodinium sp. KB8]
MLAGLFSHAFKLAWRRKGKDKEDKRRFFYGPSRDSCDSIGPSTPVLSRGLPESRNEEGTTARQRRIEQMAHIVNFPSLLLQLQAPEDRLLSLVSLLESGWETL